MNTNEKSGRIPELDGLRGVAILLVLFYHYCRIGQPSPDGSAAGYFAALFRLGWSGVDLFFVLSGFLIGGILMDARESPSYFRTFYLRRVHRILPAYYVWVTLFAVAMWVGPRLVAGAEVHSNVPLPFYYLFLQNLVFVAQATVAWFWLSPAWSLAVEEQFYLVAPPLVRWLSPQRLRGALIATILLAPALRVLLALRFPDAPQMAYVLMPCRADALAFGVLAAMAWRSEAARQWLTARASRLRIVLLVMFAGLAVMLKFRWAFFPYSFFMISIGYTLLAAAYCALLLYVLLATRSIAARVMRWRLLREWGKVSYCTYLIHLAVLGGCHYFILGAEPRIHDLPGAGVTLLAAALTFALAQLSWRTFEKPLLQRGQRHTFALPQATEAAHPVQPASPEPART